MKKLFISAAALLLFVGCNNDKPASESMNKENNTTVKEGTQETKEEQNRQIALTCIKAWSNGNIDEIVKYFMQLWNSSVNNYKSDNELAVADGDYVFVYAGWSGTFKADFMGMKTTGKSFKFKDVDIFKFDDESKITEHRAVHFSTVLKQLASQAK